MSDNNNNPPPPPVSEEERRRRRVIGGGGGDLTIPLREDLELLEEAGPPLPLPPIRSDLIPPERGLGDGSVVVVANYNQVMGELLNFWRRRLGHGLQHENLRSLEEEERVWL